MPSSPASLRRWTILLASVCLVWPTTSCASRPTVAGRETVDARARNRPRLLGTLSDRRVRESSGLAASRLCPDAGWTHNDSGDGPFVYAFGLDGRCRGRYALDGALAKDWEDMASVTMGNRAWLLLADVGDNGRDRDHCTLYIAPEPTLKPTRWFEGAIAPAAEVHFRYSDGPRDCEAVAVDPTDGSIYLVSKVFFGWAGLYRLDWPMPDAAEARADGGPTSRPTSAPAGELPVQASMRMAERVGTVRLPLVTGMDISPNGRRAVLLTYGAAYEYERCPGESWPTALRRRGRRIELPPLRQVEAVCFGPEGRSLWVTREGLPCPLWEVPLSPAQAAPSDEKGRSAGASVQPKQ